MMHWSAYSASARSMSGSTGGVTISLGNDRGTGTCTCPNCGYSICGGHGISVTVADDRRNYFDDLERPPPEPIDGLAIALNWWREPPERPSPRLKSTRRLPPARAPPVDL